MKKLAPINPSVLWFWIIVLGLLVLSFLFAPTAKLINLSEVKFTTTSSSLLYFKNIRSYYYNIDETKKPLVVYRLKTRGMDPNRPHFDFSIISNPLKDEAYIYLETVDWYKQFDGLNVYIVEPNTDTTYFKGIDKANNEYHFQFAAAVYQSLLGGHKIYWEPSESKNVELFTEGESHKNAEVVLEDYFNLVNKL